MDIIQVPRKMHDAALRLKATGSLGFVPTMGFLHEGHLSLIRAAKAADRHVAVSIFVNPAQFGPSEDLSRYPRDMEGDLAACRASGVDVVFAPDADAMYPGGAVTSVEVAGVITDRLCGASRPGHFRGVATVVAKLFNIVAPDNAYFGAKDFQQTVVIRRMVRDLDFPVNVSVLPTVREPDGLAMSSRNSYLAPDERTAAAGIYAALTAARTRYESGVTSAAELVAGIGSELSGGMISIEYAECVEPDGLQPVTTAVPGTVIAVAAKLGGTRLIDNITL